MKLRRANADDAGKLSLLGGAAFLESFADDHPGDDLVDYVAEAHSTGYYAAVLADPDCAVWIVEHGVGSPIGYAILGPAVLPGSGADDLELKRIYMLYRWHGTGFGAALYDAVEAEARVRGARRLVLAVYPQNLKAQRFYRARGFEHVGGTTFMVGKTEFEDLVFAKPL